METDYIVIALPVVVLAALVPSAILILAGSLLELRRKR